MCDFEGSDDTFWKWEQQVELLRTTYQLNENALRVLISSKLKGRAASWFHSKSQHLTLTIADLLSEMKNMFDHRPSRLSFRKEFENRMWKGSEKFADYLHDKVILGNRVPTADDEIIDYLIDGISDQRLQNQARMMQFRTTADLLRAFDKISSNPRKNGKKKEAKSSRIDQAERNLAGLPPTRVKPVRCFNCQESGHMAATCPKPKRQQGTCFGCGSALHRWNECTQRARRRSSEAPRQSSGGGAVRGPSATTSTNVLQPVLCAPYMVGVKYSVCDKHGYNCEYAIRAIVDSGSPISLIKNSFVPLEARLPLENEEPEFCGINGARLEVLGIFYHDVETEGIAIKLKFKILKILKTRNYDKNGLLFKND
ncbi:Retrotransposon-derived protein PEG10 [Anthophora quadrimaculata]